MLVLTRKQNESIIVIFNDGRLIELRISKIENDRVKLALDAPKDIRIFRKEIYDVIAQSNASAQLNTSSETKSDELVHLVKKIKQS